MWCLVFLPLSLSFFIDLLENNTVKDLAKAAAFTSLTMWTFPNLVPILFVTLFVMFIGYLVLTQSRMKYLKKVFPRFLLLALIVLVSNSPFIFMQYKYTGSSLYGFEASSVLRDFRSTYEYATILNFVRLAGNIGSPQQPLGYNNVLDPRNEIGIILPIVVLSGFILVRKPPIKKVSAVMLASAVFILLFAMLLRSAVYSELSWIIEATPVLWTLRNPFKLQLMFTVCVIPLFIASLERIGTLFVDSLRKRHCKIAALTFLLIFLGVSHIYVYNSFVFSGFMGLDKTYSDRLQSYLPDATISSIIAGSSEWYAEGLHRGIVFPFDHLTELHVQFTNPLLYPSRLGLTSKVINEITNELAAKSGLTNLLSLLSTKYVYTNYAWKDTGFHIIQPENVSEVAEILRGENLSEEFSVGYSKFTVETALPRLYLSSYPVFYSNIETVGLLNRSIFYAKPVFCEIEYDGSETNATIPLVFNSYSWNVPIRGTYDTYAVVYGGEQELPIYYCLDGSELNSKTANIAENGWTSLGRFDLEAGFHKLWLAVNETTSIMNLDKYFEGEGSWNVDENTIEIRNGRLQTLQEFSDFNLDLQFKPIEFGKESWNGPDVYFAMSDSSYLRFIFHKENYLELAKANQGGYSEGVLVKEARLMANSWNNLRILKNGEMLSLYLNGEHLLTYRDALMNHTGSIGIGSDRSCTWFRNVTVSKDPISGLWLMPAETPTGSELTIEEMGPEKYRLQLNQTAASKSVLVLGENYDPSWEAKMDGKALDHSKANTYANCWFIDATQGAHEIEIHYAPGTTYTSLLYVSQLTVCLLIGVSYFPIASFRRLFRLMAKKRTRKSD